MRCAHDDELELQSAAAARERKDAAHRMKMVSSARRSGASFCFMVLRRRRRARTGISVALGPRDGAPPRRAREGGGIYKAPRAQARGEGVAFWEAEARDRAEKRRRALETLR